MKITVSLPKNASSIALSPLLRDRLGILQDGSTLFALRILIFLELLQNFTVLTQPEAKAYELEKLSLPLENDIFPAVPANWNAKISLLVVQFYHEFFSLSSFFTRLRPSILK